VAEAGEHRDLLSGKRGPHQTDAILDACLMHRDHVRVPLAEHDRPGARSGTAGEMLAKDMPALVKQVALRAVQVLRRIVGAHRAGTEAQDAAAAVAQREGDASTEPVVHAPRPIARALHKPCREQLLVAERRTARGEQHAIPCARGVTDAKAP